jgi:dipeptidyl aminopeptidase/acylaminoacyl peptidase
MATWQGFEGLSLLTSTSTGYASMPLTTTLVGLTFTPDEFVCGVDEMGPSNLITLLQSNPPYWTPMLGEFKKRVGDWQKDADSLKARSPLFKADRIKVPLFIVQGANEPRVKQAESDQIVQAVRKSG